MSEFVYRDEDGREFSSDWKPGGEYNAAAERGASRAELAGLWFHQFDHHEPPENWPEDAQWCWRHWAPAVLFGANGITAACETTVRWAEVHPGFTGKPTVRMCCELGDEVMYDIWAQSPPDVPVSMN